LHLNRKILTVALLRLRFCSIAATKSDPNLSAILTILFWDRPLADFDDKSSCLPLTSGTLSTLAHFRHFAGNRTESLMVA
ncbi:MAG: hypothetical protein ACOY4W_19770, partial [Thermodesulfobacteriota bacterium]